MCVEDKIRDFTNKSDILFGSDLYAEISHELTDVGINLAFFVFTTSENSSCARTLEGEPAAYPVVAEYIPGRTALIINDKTRCLVAR